MAISQRLLGKSIPLLKGAGKPRIRGDVPSNLVESIWETAAALREQFPIANVSQINLFGDVEDWVRRTGGSPTEFGHATRSGKINMNIHRLLTAGDARPGWSIGTDIATGARSERFEQAIMAHEWGHHVQYGLQRHTSLESPFASLPRYTESMFAKAFEESFNPGIASRIAQDVHGELPRAIGRRIQSTYAGKNPKEAFAETFSLGFLTRHNMADVAMRDPESYGAVASRRFLQDVERIQNRVISSARRSRMRNQLRQMRGG